MKIEKEIRYYFSNKELPELVEKLKRFYAYEYSYHEVTTMYDNPNPEFTFYSKEVDGRLRLRYSNIVDSEEFGAPPSEASADTSKCLVTWKRRLPENKGESIRCEEEIEYTTPAGDFDAVRSILENVLQCKRVSSYERIRNFLSAENIQVTCDQFPYGIMLELEMKNSQLGEGMLIDEVERLGLKLEDASELSCDDMYFKLCEESGVQQLPDIAFADKTMPQIA